MNLISSDWVGEKCRSDPGESYRLDHGRITDDLDERCTLGDHDFAGMNVAIRVLPH